MYKGLLTGYKARMFQLFVRNRHSNNVPGMIESICPPPPGKGLTTDSDQTLKVVARGGLTVEQ